MAGKTTGTPNQLRCSFCNKSQEQVRVEVDRTIEKVVENISVNEVFTVESPFELGEITVTDIYHEPVEFLTLIGPEADISLVERQLFEKFTSLL